MKKNLLKRAFILAFCLTLLHLSLNVDAKEIYQVNTEKLNIREQPTKYSDALGYLRYGTPVEVLDSSNRWYKIKAGNTIGYVKGKYLTAENISDNDSTDSITSHNIKVIVIALIALISIIGLWKLFDRKEDRNYLSINPDENPYSQQQIIIKRKSVGLAIVLTCFFGPLGMLYSTIRGALVMIFLPVFGILATILFMGAELNFLGLLVLGSLFIYGIFYWIICIIWAAIAANNANKITINTLSTPVSYNANI